MLSLTTIPTMTTKLKNPLEVKFKSLLQDFLTAINDIRVNPKLIAEERILQERAQRFQAQEKFKDELGRIIVSISTDLAVMKTQILSLMYPLEYSALTDKQSLAAQLRSEVDNFLSKARTQDQIIYYFDFFLTNQKYDACFHMYELLKRTNHVATERQEGDKPNILNELSVKIEALKEKLGITEGMIEVELTERYLKQVEQLYKLLVNQVDLLLEGFNKVDSNTLQLIYETSPELYGTIEKYKYPNARQIVGSL